METNSLHVAEVIQREMEKSRIREEIMMAEVLRRHELEAEVRRELMIERAMMRSEGVSLFDLSMSSLQQSDLGGLPLHYQNGVGIGIGIGVEERLSMMSRPEVGSFQGLPFQQCRPVIQLLPELRNSLQPELKNLLPAACIEEFVAA
ncbi:hypothetical protein L1049_013276 [Liquidambar formosana]|uniref:Uncharacterized protein n=1 Tax=Liquidambar formosana TaxID=63359 RepID=A0AAP0RKA7_LIQFO